MVRIGEALSSYSGMSQEEGGTLATCLGSNNSKTLLEEVIANSPLRIG